MPVMAFPSWPSTSWLDQDAMQKSEEMFELWQHEVLW